MSTDDAASLVGAIREVVRSEMRSHQLEAVGFDRLCELLGRKAAFVNGLIASGQLPAADINPDAKTNASKLWFVASIQDHVKRRRENVAKGR